MLIVLAIVGLILAWVVHKKLFGHWSDQPGQLPRKLEFPPPPGVEIARIIEIASFSSGGMFAVFMLVIFNIGAIFVSLGVNDTHQENVALLGWIGSNILWGIGAIIGRKRTYSVRRIKHKSSPNF